MNDRTKAVTDMETWVQKAIDEYQTNKLELERYRKTLDKNNLGDQETSTVLGSMIRDMQFAITWMKRGRRPGNRRGVDKTDVYHQTAMQAILKGMDLESEQSAVNALCALSPKEIKYFLFYYREGLTQQDISNMLNVTRSTVQVTIRRAEKKLNRLLD